MATTITAGNATNGAAISSDNTGILELKTGTGSGTTAMTLNASQNVGIGTSSPNSRLDVNGLITARATGGEGGQIDFLNPDNSATGLYIDVSTADVGRVFSVRNNSSLQLGQLVGTGGTVTFYTAATERARITSDGLFQFNSGYGSVATAYGCRAWVNFNGTGTVAIRASGNVTSITDNGTGDYTVNFSVAMPDANYCAQVTADQRLIGDANTTSAPTTSAVRVSATSRIDASGLTDSAYMNVAIFR